MKESTTIQKHRWYQVESDNKGIPTKYVCVDCDKVFNIPSRDKQARDYLIQKYGKAKAS